MNAVKTVGRSNEQIIKLAKKMRNSESLPNSVYLGIPLFSL